jgi:hypothetical protein
VFFAYRSVSTALPFTACPNVAEYSNEKPFSHNALRKRIQAPSPPLTCTTVPFVHQHEVVAFEGVHRHGLVAHLVAQPGDFDDLYGLPGEQAAPVLVEQLGLDARRLELAQMLLGQAFVRREQDDAVEFSPTAVLGQ